MSLDRETLEKVLGLQEFEAYNGLGDYVGPAIPSVTIAALLKGLTEAGEAPQRVMKTPHGELHYYERECCLRAGLEPCDEAPTAEADAWALRQRKDSHAG